MKSVSTFILISTLSVLNAANGLRCYDCLQCSTVDASTGTQSCEGSQTIAGVTMKNKCASINIYEGPYKGVSRRCAPNVIDGCMDIDYGGYKAKVCYCTDDDCNTHVFDNRPTASPSTTPLGQKLQCYECTNCPTTSSSTPKGICEGTKTIAGVEMPMKCAIFHIYEGPNTGYLRQCSPNVINGCLDMDYMGYKANVCYCTTDRCNGGQPGLTSTKGPHQPSPPGSHDRDKKQRTDPGNDASRVRGSLVVGSLISLLILNLLKE